MPGPRFELGPPKGDGILSPKAPPNNGNDLDRIRYECQSALVVECRELSAELGHYLAPRRTCSQRQEALWKRILELHRWRCAYCGGRENIVREHMFPKSRGGDDALENIVPACQTCNSRKGTRTPLEWFLGIRPGQYIEVRLVAVAVWADPLTTSRQDPGQGEP